MSVVGSALGWALGGALGAPSGSAAPSDPFWETVALRCPEARALLADDYAAERAGIEEILNLWTPSSAPAVARVYLARHLVVSGSYGASGRTGAIASESLGPSSVSYAAAGGGSASSDWGSTQWGKLYRDLVCSPGPELIL